MPPDERETVRNEERGCGFLKHSKGYLRSPPRSADGVLPPFVRFDPAVPYLERSKFRGYEYFPGVEFELAVTGPSNVPETVGEWIRPSGVEDDVGDEETNDLRGVLDGISDEGGFSTDPPGEIWRHIARTTGDASGLEHAGEVPQFQTRDLFMLVGKSYYDSPDEFIEEVREQGLSKAIPVSESQEPPRVEPGRTRLFLVHPNAVYYEETEERKPGIIGYVYLHRTIYTEDEKGRFPAWAQEQAGGRDDMDLVHIGDQIYEDGTRTATLNEDDEFGNGDTAEGESESSPERVQPSDKPGRDVEGVPVEDDDSNLDEDEIRDQLDAAEDEIREFAENETTVSEDYPEVEFVEIPRPDECPECGSETDEETTDDGDTVTFCPGCGWDNFTRINAAVVESNLRRESYNSLQRRASEEGVHPGGQPAQDDLVRALLDDMGLL